MSKKKRETLSKFLPQGRQDPRDFKLDSAKPLFHDGDDHNTMHYVSGHWIKELKSFEK